VIVVIAALHEAELCSGILPGTAAGDGAMLMEVVGELSELAHTYDKTFQRIVAREGPTRYEVPLEAAAETRRWKGATKEAANRRPLELGIAATSAIASAS
jgi:hypothetical protein